MKVVRADDDALASEVFQALLQIGLIVLRIDWQGESEGLQMFIGVAVPAAIEGIAPVRIRMVPLSAISSMTRMWN